MSSLRFYYEDDSDDDKKKAKNKLKPPKGYLPKQIHIKP